MQTAERIKWLQRMPLFGAICDEALGFIVDRTRSVAVPTGSHFFREGDEASSMYVLESGHVVVLRDWQGCDLPIKRFGPGDCFGEMALMDLQPRSASVRAETDCVALELLPATLFALYELDIAQFTLLQMNIGREVCRRLRATDEQLFRARMGEAFRPVPAAPERPE